MEGIFFLCYNGNECWHEEAQYIFLLGKAESLYTAEQLHYLHEKVYLPGVHDLLSRYEQMPTSWKLWQL